MNKTAKLKECCVGLSIIIGLQHADSVRVFLYVCESSDVEL